jgi:hypothetical protein
MSTSGPAPSSEEERSLLDLSIRYAATVDRRDGDGFSRLFEPEGELMVPAYPDDLRPVVRRKGRAELRRIPSALDGYAVTFHQVSNPHFRIEGDDAAGSVQCVAHHITGEAGDGEAVDVVWFIRYDDTYRREKGRWRFRRRVLHLQWVEQHRVERVGLPWPASDGVPDQRQDTGTGWGGTGPT